MREPVPLPGNQRFDWPGSFSFTIGLGSLLLAASLLAFPMVSMISVYGLFVVGIFGLVAFVMIERRVSQPMLDLRLFRDKLFAFACAANALNGLARSAVLFSLIFFLQGPYGLDPLWAGIMMAPYGVAFMLVGPDRATFLIGSALEDWPRLDCLSQPSPCWVWQRLSALPLTGCWPSTWF